MWDIVRLSHRGLGVRDFSRAVARALRRVVPFDGFCVVTVDPATLLQTGEVVENGLPDWAMGRLTQIEVAEADVNRFVDLARATRPAASLSEATGGDLDRSVRQRELRRPAGFEDEMRAASVDGGDIWGGLTLLREAGTADFTPDDAQLIASLSGPLAQGLRRALLVAAVKDGNNDNAEVGVLVLAEDDSIELANAAAQEWLDELRQPEHAHLPIVIQAVATRARRAAAGDGSRAAARARIRTASGR